MSEFKMPDMSHLMKMAQEMQNKMSKAKEDMASLTCDVSSGGGMVTLTMNGNYEILSLNIEQEIIDPDDPEMLCDLVRAALNQGISKVREMTQEEMSKLTGGVSIPGMSSLF